MNDFLAHLGPGTEYLQEALNNKDYDGALAMVHDIKEKWKLSETQLDYLNKLKKNITELKNNQA